jgi:hypothetical protein
MYIPPNQNTGMDHRNAVRMADHQLSGENGIIIIQMAPGMATNFKPQIRIIGDMKMNSLISLDFI